MNITHTIKNTLGALVLTGALFLAIGTSSPVFANEGTPGGGETNLNLLKKTGNINGGPTMTELQLAPKNNQKVGKSQ